MLLALVHMGDFLQGNVSVTIPMTDTAPMIEFTAMPLILALAQMIPQSAKGDFCTTVYNRVGCLASSWMSLRCGRSTLALRSGLPD